MRKLTLDDREFESFRAFIEKECAISLASSKRYLLETRLAKLVAESGCSDFTEFYRSVVSRKQPNLKEKIIDASPPMKRFGFAIQVPGMRFGM